MAASNKSPSTVFVGKITPSTTSQIGEDHVSSPDEPVNPGKDHMSSDKESSGEVKIEVNGHVSPGDSGMEPRPASSVCSQDGCSSSASSVSLASQDQNFASREALIEQLAGSTRILDKTDKEVVSQLLEHIVALKMDIEGLREDNRRLKGMRSAMDEEMHTLTENLFSEAYKMVDEAKGGKMSAEKRLADAAGKIDAMETEMSALRNLLSVPGDRPNSPHKHSRSPTVKRMIKRIKSTSKSKKSTSPSASSIPGTPIKLVEHRTVMQGECLCEGEISPQDFQEFSQWLEGLGSSEEHKYIDDVIDVDVRQCLRFHDDRISEQVLEAVRENDLLMEALATPETRKCSLSGNDGVVCTHRLKLGSSDDWLYISQWCRDRIAAACDFYMYVGHIKKGIVKQDATKLYWQVRKLRAMMSLARLSLKLPQ